MLWNFPVWLATYFLEETQNFLSKKEENTVIMTFPIMIDHWSDCHIEEWSTDPPENEEKSNYEQEESSNKGKNFKEILSLSCEKEGIWGLKKLYFSQSCCISLIYWCLLARFFKNRSLMFFTISPRKRVFMIFQRILPNVHWQITLEIRLKNDMIGTVNSIA